MKVLVGTLFIALAAFHDSVESSEGSSSGSSRSSPNRIVFVKRGDEVSAGLYYEGPRGNLQPLPDQAAIYEFGPYLIGFVIQGHTRVVPLFNRNHEVVWQNRLNSTDQIVVSREAAAYYFGMPGTLQEVEDAIYKRKEPHRAQVRQDAELERPRSAGSQPQQSAEDERERAAENEREQSAESRARQGNTNRGKQRGRGGKYAKTRGN